ncbi:glucose 1-dehydrogenase [Desulfopila aestuarii]|uniref:NAD(P)-dependent dehydrogenase, short-chain alcohol dehydrogenase family n=1 Tax=Desulfopila aestuarii DSM 18488 TaxID=1121416 RepID=A0A1M7Y7F9_9BACT|nr:glucose 1-dehydrogenase [Desulfopila aestuarii]SHO48550.1 NAD(P)-dependent dehydrogenase, short-chain alcohol dehydrogenase family [Desulfopila aestuarii DSM 18488]
MVDIFKTVIVTGGAQGIGRGMVDYFLLQGWNVVMADIDNEAGNEVLEYHEADERLVFSLTDVRSEASVRACIGFAVDRFGAIDGLVNNAGIASPGRIPVTDLSLDDWEKMIGTNLTGAYLMAKHAAPFLKERKGAIVNISSTRALQSEPNTEAYSASKGGLVSLTHALAVSLGHAVRVNCILPGWIDVSNEKKSTVRIAPQLSEEDHLQHPAGRVGAAKDIAALTAFLLGEEASFITGQSFVVDGGMTKKMMYIE